MRRQPDGAYGQAPTEAESRAAPVVGTVVEIGVPYQLAKGARRCSDIAREARPVDRRPPDALKADRAAGPVIRDGTPVLG